jgi:UDP-glucose 4-epimerase
LTTPSPPPARRASDDANGRVFNLGGEPVISLKDLAALLIEIEGKGRLALRPFPEDRRRIDIGDYYADSSLVRRVLGWRPAVPLRDGLVRTLAFYREHLSHYL